MQEKEYPVITTVVYKRVEKCPFCHVAHLFTAPHLFSDCGNPFPPVNGEVIYNETIYGSDAQYICNTGFELVGSKAVTCREDELWSETGQYCRLKGKDI